MSTNIDYVNVLNSLEKITDAGLIYEDVPEDYREKRKNLEGRYDEFKFCCEWIEKYRFHPTDKQFKKFVQVQTYNSYYLKHFVEKWSGKYISNGAFIAAVRFMGLPFRPIYGTPDVSVTFFIKEEATLL